MVNANGITFIIRAVASSPDENQFFFFFLFYFDKKVILSLGVENTICSLAHL